MFHKILIANRGEIAVRIIRACKELGIKTVSVFSESDAQALHVPLADESICIGPSDSQKSYLNLPNIITAADITGCDAIHPGYGFLAENHFFAEICGSCNITFIGPRPETIKMMGNKVSARHAMRKAGVPVLPGSEGSVESAEEALEVAHEIGYPLIIKSSAGGGGRGMRIVRTDEDLINSFALVKSEAFNSFGNAEIYIEKYIEHPKHIEFQILCDSKNNRVHLGERDCSIQRRYQKLLEESPSPAVNAKIRKEMGQMSLRIAEVVQYESAGTVEYLLDSCGKFYFIEVNTRIQVEHPITEMITGIDIIKEQIKIAAGESLGYSQKDVGFYGHSIECRVNAEDSEKFLPSCGKIHTLKLPEGKGVRIDTALSNNYTVSPYYDSLLAKLIVHGKDRNEAIGKMKKALDEFIIDGVQTTIPFHKKVLFDKDFNRGVYFTSFSKKFNGTA